MSNSQENQPTPSFGRSFLSATGQFPDDGMAASWGEQAIVIALPGGPYRLSGLQSSQARQVQKVFGAYCVGPQMDAAVDISVARIADHRFLPLQSIDWCQLIDVDYGPQIVKLAAFRWLGQIDLSREWRAILWTPMTDGSPFSDAIENFLRILVAYRLLASGGLLIHSAAVIDGAGAQLFAGASGDGKSTLAKLCLARGLDVLSDDGNALLFAADGTLMIEALPFGGDLRPRVPPKGKFPLRSISALRKGQPTRLDPLGRARAIALIFAAALFVNGDPFRRDQVLARAAALSDAVPTRRLTFGRHGGFHDLVFGASRVARAS